MYPYNKLSFGSAIEAIDALHGLSHSVGPIKLKHQEFLAKVIGEGSYNLKYPDDPIIYLGDRFGETKTGRRILIVNTTSKKLFFKDRDWFPHPQSNAPIFQSCDFILIVKHSEDFTRFSSIMIDWDDIPQFLGFDWNRDMWHTYLSKAFINESEILLPESDYRKFLP